MYKTMFILVLYTSYLPLISATLSKKEPVLPPWDVDDGWFDIYPATDDPLIWDNWKFEGQTPPPKDDELAKKHDNSRFYIALFLITFFLIIVIVAYLKYFYFENASSRASSVSDLLALCDSHGGPSQCYSLTTPAQTITYERPQIIVNCIPYLPIYSICRHSTVDKPPDYDDVVQGDFMFPRVENYVPETPCAVLPNDNRMRY